ncbi:MAG TPA: Clp protease N-terminal domain-containing protein [Tepidisphaeraceae bacterium]|jgi:ATP-dependent Clp protease ATP-binding subunit ClpC
MFDRFTDRARRTLTLASQEAMRLRHDHVGTEHLLLGLVKEGSGLAAVVLQQFDISLATVRQKVEQLVHGPSSANPPAKLRQTERYTRVLGYAIDEANALSNNYVGTEHLLLGLLRESEGTAARVLAGLNLKLDDVRTAVLNLLGKSPSSKTTLLERAINEITPKLADEEISPDKVRAVVEALIHAGWRPQQ